MKIGIVGLGVVGSAVRHGLERIGHELSVFDIKLEGSSLWDVRNSELTFVCVPSPCAEDGSCDVRPVVNTVRSLAEAEYRGVVAIKSTVTPGTTERMIREFPSLRLAFCPEFLRERAAYTDFVDNHDVCVIGARGDSEYDIIRRAHGHLPKRFFRLTPTEAELSKYFSNLFNALRIVFANEFFEVCKSLNADYGTIKNAVVHRSTIEDAYLDCNDRFRGFGGLCLPKDTTAFAALVRSLGLNMKLFEAIVEENKKFKVTVPEGMRPR
jgi:UDPglucose 6-dehydrogenase